ncbi:MAG: FxsA family protein [Pseudomonadota bacterium]
MWIFLALVAVPIIEIALFIEIGGWIGLWPTIATVILTALIGTLLLRQQGFAALNDLQTRLSEGRDPSSALAHGAMILIAGIVLLTPGFFTDAIGFLLLIPPVRTAVITTVGQRIKIHAASHFQARTGHPPHGGPHASPGNKTIDGDYQDVTPPEEQEVPGNSAWTRKP